MKEVLELFDILDETSDGFLYENEFEVMFSGVDSWNSHNHNIINSVLRDSTMFKYGMRPSGNIDLDLA